MYYLHYPPRLETVITLLVKFSSFIPAEMSLTQHVQRSPETRYK